MEYTGEIDEKKQIKQRTAKPLLWVTMVGIGMAFAALTSAYIIRQASSDWLTFEFPSPFFISTAFIAASSVTMFLAVRAAKKSDQKMIVNGLILTLVLGIAFVISQFYAYRYMAQNELFLVGTSVSSSFLYLLTGFHLAHVFSGIITLAVTLTRALRKKYSADNYLGLSLASIYWHFLDLLWVYLLLFLVFIR